MSNIQFTGRGLGETFVFEDDDTSQTYQVVIRMTADGQLPCDGTSLNDSGTATGHFTFKPKYWDERFIEFPMHGPDAVRWARELNLQFGRSLLEMMRAQRN